MNIYDLEKMLDFAVEYDFNVVILSALWLEQHNNKKYDLHPYPWLSKLDDLLMGLQDGTMFTEIAERLYIHNKIAVVEAYIE